MLAIFGENKGHSFISEPKLCQINEMSLRTISLQAKLSFTLNLRYVRQQKLFFQNLSARSKAVFYDFENLELGGSPSKSFQKFFASLYF